MMPTSRARSVTAVARLMAGNRRTVGRYASRPMRIMPPLRPAEPAHGPTRADVVRQWEELEWWNCTYCDASAGATVVLEMDHITPLAKGGVHEWTNLQPSCAECNRLKADRDVAEWLSLAAGHEVDDSSALPDPMHAPAVDDRSQILHKVTFT